MKKYHFITKKKVISIESLIRRKISHKFFVFDMAADMMQKNGKQMKEG